MTAYVSREDYRRWAQAQPRGRFERINGQVVKMPAEQAIHARLKAAIWRAFADAIGSAGLEAEAFPDGMTVEVGADTDYEPDGVINLGPLMGPRDLAVPNPVVVAEVLSHGTQSLDLGGKLDGYFRVPSIAHYLIVGNTRRQVVHHRRDGAGIATSVVTEGGIVLDPPGIVITVDQVYRRSGL